jgi:hypothetical protein
MLHSECVTTELLEVLKDLNSIPELNEFRLVGGTAIALQLGHRKSIDIDFFSNTKVDKTILRNVIQKRYPGTETFASEHSVTAEVRGVRVELFDDWDVPFREPVHLVAGVRMATLRDLAAFKISAITGRREKKDYIDLFLLFEKLGAMEVLKGFKLYDPLLSPKSILFALSQVDSAIENKSPMPEMIKKIDWHEVELSMVGACKKFEQHIRQNRPSVG